MNIKEKNEIALKYAKKKGYDKNNNLILIIGSSNNDERFKDMYGFTISMDLEFGEKEILLPDKNENLNLIHLNYNLEEEKFFKEIKKYGFKFKTIFFDYNVIYLINNTLSSFFHYFFNLLDEEGQFYIPYHFKNSPIIIEKGNNYILENLKEKTFSVDIQKLNIFEKVIYPLGQRYRFIKDNKIYTDITSDTKKKEDQLLLLNHYFKNNKDIKIEEKNSREEPYIIKPRDDKYLYSIQYYFIIKKLKI